LNCAADTGITDSRLPRWISAKPSSRSAASRISSRRMVRLSLRSNATSTADQRGSSAGLFGSW